MNKTKSPHYDFTKPKWIGNGSTFRLYLGHPKIEVMVDYEGFERLPHDAPHWNVYVFGIKTPRRCDTLEDAQRLALRRAKAFLDTATKALASLVEEQPQSP